MRSKGVLVTLFVRLGRRREHLALSVQNVPISPGIKGFELPFRKVAK